MRKLKVALNRPKGVGETIAYARFVASRMEGNPYFPSPLVAVAALSTHLAALEAAEVVARTRVHGGAKARDDRLSIVHDDLMQLRAYVEAVASLRAEDAEAVVASSGMNVKQSAGPRKAPFAAKDGRRSGSVTLIVRHPGGVTSFDWQYSTDGTHWVDAPRTVQARADLDGLTPGVLYSFRYRTLTKEGLSDWSDPITLMVL
jgi:hypothetical protein